MKESKYVGTKMAAGYLLLLAAGIFAIHQVWRETETLSQPDPYGELLQHRRNVIGYTLYQLCQAEGTGQLMLLGGKDYEAEYRAGMTRVRGCIDSLRSLASDSLQSGRLDTIEALVAAKERSMLRLKGTLRKGSDELMSRNIGDLMPSVDTLHRDSLVPELYLHRDTVVTARQKRNFFRRFADLFSPPKEEQSVVVSSRIAVDSVAAPHILDTISTVLHRLEEHLNQEQRSLYEQAWRESERMSRANRKIDQQIYRLLTAYERDEAAHLAARADDTSLHRQRALRNMSRIALVATALVFLFTLILWRDLARNNRYKRQLEEADREKAALLRLREKLMLAVTHDFRAPLGSILGYTDLLHRLVSGKRERFYTDNIRSASEHLLALVESLLDLWRLDARKTEIHAVRFHPARLFREICAQQEPAAAAKGLALRCETEVGEEKALSGDPVRIRQIADNLLSNALKFTDRGEVVVRVSLDGGNLCFSVRDTGRGMTGEEKSRIFGEFERLRSAEGVGGFGLGLSIVDRTVRLLGGTIAVDSCPGRGSRFLVTLPVDEAAETESVALAPLRILLVDDDRLQLEMTAALCRRTGLDPAICDRPEYAAEWVRSERFDLLATDLQMPGLDGFRLLAQLRETGCELPVIAVSARAESEEELLERGFGAVLRKPFSSGELVRAIRAACPDRADRIADGPADEPEGFASLTAFASGDAAAEREILRTFSRQVRADAEELREAFAAGDGERGRKTAHRLLPLFRQLNRHVAATVLEELETGRTCSEERFRGLLAELERAAAEAEKECETLLEEEL